VTLDAWLTLGVLALVLVGLVRGRWSADIVLLSGMLALVVMGVLDTRTALAGFGNEGLMTIAALFVVAVGLQDTGASVAGIQRILGSTATVFGAQVRIVLTSSLFSAFLNNTAVVATLLPVVHDWARRRKMAASKLLIPLSYATILGGTLTLIGTSTNLVVNGLIVAGGRPSLGVFDVTGVGLIALLVGVVYLLTIGARLLPDRNAEILDMYEAREYTAEMVVIDGSPLVGRTIEEAGLRHLQGAYLMEIHRGSQLLAVVGPEERLSAGDQLVFVGIVESVLDLQKIPGLAPATNQLFKLEGPRHRRALVEAVVSNTCPLVGRTIREGGFRLRYGAVVLAVSRNGQRIRQKIGDIVLLPGDTLLLEALPSFVEQQRHSRDFFLVSQIEGAAPPRHERMGVSLLILAGLVTASMLLGMPIFHAAVLAAAAMLLTGCTSGTRARESLDLRLLVAIAAAIGLGAAMERSGLAAFAAQQAVLWISGDPWWALLLIYLLTSLFTEMVTNNAAAVLVFPVAEATAAGLGVDAMPFFVAVMFAASASFATPIGYQTNLMVYGPGGYRFSDFLRVGLPLNLLLAVTTCIVLPWFFPFGG
jgi:di/tricarboxylate transporter